MISGQYQGGWVSQGKVTGGAVTAWVKPASPEWVDEVSVTISTTASDHVLYLAQYVPSQAQRVPDTNLYDYYTTTLYQKPIGPVTSTYTFLNIQSDLFSIGSMPSRIFLYIRPTQLTTAGISTNNSVVPLMNTFAFINGVNVTLNGRPGILSTFKASSLWRLSAKNGYDFPYPSWTDPDFRGSVLILNPVEDFGGLPEGYSSSSAGNFQFSFYVTYFVGALGDDGASLANWELDVVFLQSGFTVAQNISYSQVTSFVTPSQLLEAPFAAPMAVRASSGPVGSGGGGGSFTEGIQKIGNFLSSILGPAAAALSIHSYLKGRGGEAVGGGGGDHAGDGMLCKRPRRGVGGGAQTLSVRDL